MRIENIASVLLKCSIKPKKAYPDSGFRVTTKDNYSDWLR